MILHALFYSYPPPSKKNPTLYTAISRVITKTQSFTLKFKTLGKGEQVAHGVGLVPSSQRMRQWEFQICPSYFLLLNVGINNNVKSMGGGRKHKIQI